MTIRRAVSVLVLGALPVLTGCLRTTHTVQMTRPPQHVLDATLDELLKQTEDRYNAVKTMTAAVTIVYSTGGGKQGKITQYTSANGHILMRKPADLRVILSAFGLQVVDMITDGKTFTMLVRQKGLAIKDSNEEPATPSQSSVYNLRPQMFFDSMFVRGPEPGELKSRTMDERVYQPDPGKKDLIAEPDYDIAILRQRGEGTELQTRRVIHIGRATLLPYRQDIYNDAGQLVTQAFYDKYQKIAGVDVATKITIQRPVDQLQIVVTIDPAQLILNQPLENSQFELTVPDNYKICKPSAAPCQM